MAYSIGTISITANSSTITGNGTYFVQVAKAQKADLLFVHYEGQDRILQVVSVVDDLTLQVKQLDGSVFEPGSSASSLKYGLVQNFTDTVTAKLAQRVADLQTQWFTREQQMTGWFESSADTYPVTGFLGEQVNIPTPAKIAALAQVAMEASDALAQMATAIEQNQTTLATVEPRLATFESQYQFVVSANNNVTQKHNEVVLKHDQVMQTASIVESLATTVELQSNAVQQMGEQVTADAEQVSLSAKHTAAHCQLSVDSANIAERKALDCGNVLTQVQQLNDALTQSINSVTVTINDAASSAEQTIEQLGAAITEQTNTALQTVSEQAQSVTNDAKRFSQDIKASESVASDAADTAVLKANQCVLANDAIQRVASEANALATELTQNTTLANDQAQQAKQQIEQMHAQVGLMEKHVAAHSALSTLSIQVMTSSTNNIKTAFQAVLEGTLTTQQINNLF